VPGASQADRRRAPRDNQGAHTEQFERCGAADAYAAQRRERSEPGLYSAREAATRSSAEQPERQLLPDMMSHAGPAGDDVDRQLDRAPALALLLDA
jgi:hypothetical protein